jgi:hypothetical protein
MRTEGIGHLKILQGPYRGSNTEPPALWRNATTNRGTARAPLQMNNTVVIFIASIHYSIICNDTK